MRSDRGFRGFYGSRTDSRPGLTVAGLRTVRRRLSDPRVRRSIERILRENVLCSISTLSDRRRAHIHTAYFAWSPALDLYFLSAPSSTHARNLAANPSAAIAVYRSTQSWGGSDRGLQFFGTCREAMGRDAERAELLYSERFPRYGRMLAAITPSGKRAARQLRSYRFYRFVPRRIKILDERAFGGGVFVVASVRHPKSARRPASKRPRR